MQLKIYHPLPLFPPLSLSGKACQLNCRHCDSAYLRGMAPARTSDDLLHLCHKLAAEGAIGVLISGGSTRDGAIINLKKSVRALRRVKAETGLILNLHPGLIDAATAQALGDVIDVASLEIPSNATIQQVFGLEAQTADYLATYDRLQAAGIPVVPHVAIYDGTEARLLQSLMDHQGRRAPESIVVIVFSPTRNTPMADASPPSADQVSDVIAQLGTWFPATEIALGCMRPRSLDLRVAIERAALEAGAVRMELPSQQTLDVARRQGYNIVHLDACCALPQGLETRALRRGAPAAV